MALKSLISDDYVNTGRQKSIDYVKSFAILYMVTIHWYEEMSVCYADGTTTILGYIIEFLGGPLAAPVFMFAMGLGMVYSKHRTPKELFLRGLKILIFSYLFNILRLSFSYFVVGKIAGYFDLDTFLYYTFNIDILSFCGIAFMFTALLKKLNIHVWAVPQIAIIMLIIGSFINYESTSIIGKYVLSLFVKSSELSYFPLFNWYIYPAMGMLAARYLKQITSQDRWHKITLRISFAIVIGIIFGSMYYGISPIQFFTIYNDIYYIQNFISALFCFNVVLLCESILYFIFKKVNSEKLDKLVFYMSDNLNTIYILQWLIIGNVLTIFFESGWIEPFPIWVSIPLGIVVTLVSTYLAKYTNKILKV